MSDERLFYLHDYLSELDTICVACHKVIPVSQSHSVYLDVATTLAYDYCEDDYEELLRCAA